MKEKIKKLLLGCKEDALIGLTLLLEHYDPEEFIKEWATEIYKNKSPYSTEDDRHGLIDNGFTTKDKMFYYKVKRNLYILLRIGSGPFICHENYDRAVEVINHK